MGLVWDASSSQWVQADEDRARSLRVWNAIGSFALGADASGDTDLIVSNRAGQFTIDTAHGRATQGRAAVQPVLTIAGYPITWPMLLIGGAVAWLALKK